MAATIFTAVTCTIHIPIDGVLRRAQQASRLVKPVK